MPGDGDHILLESQVGDGCPIYAMGWNDKKLTSIVSTCGTTVAGLPSRRPRHRKVFRDGEWVTEVYVKEVKRTRMIADFFQYFSIIDVHDHYRQGSLELERHWITHCWWHRMFSTIFGICIVDAYLCFKFEVIQRQELPSRLMTFQHFLAGIFNDLIEEGHNFREQDGSANVSSPEVPEVNTSLTLHLHEGQSHFQFQVHYLAPLSTLPFGPQKASRCLRRCRHKGCGKNASCYCVGCSNVEQKIIVPYCGPSTGRLCFAKHMQ